MAIAPTAAADLTSVMGVRREEGAENAPANNAARSAAAVDAFEKKDSDASRNAHSEEAIAMMAEESHASSETGDMVKSLVFGGLDGIITTFAIVAASAGGGFDTKVVILMGFSSILADGLSMGMGDFISERAEQLYVAQEYEREAWEMEHFLEGEVNEMIALWIGKGMTEKDARLMINTLVKYKKLFLNQMFVDELGLMPPPEDKTEEFRSTLRKGICTFLSFIVCGSFPLAGYVIARAAHGPTDPAWDQILFMIASIIAAFTMFALGFVKGRMTKQPAIRSGFSILLNGAVAASIAYFVGWFLDQLLTN